MSEENGMSPADIIAMMNNGGMGANGWNNPFVYFLFLAMFGNGNFGGWNRGNYFGDAATQGALTRAELTDGLNNQTIMNDLRGLSAENDRIQENVHNNADRILGSSTVTQNIVRDVGDKIAGMNFGLQRDIDHSTCGIERTIDRDTNILAKTISDFSAAQQLANCGINRNIDDVKYEMSKNCCELKTALHQEGELTRGLMQQNTIQELRDKLAEKDNTLQAANLTLANAQQTQTILNSLGTYYPACKCNPGW